MSQASNQTKQVQTGANTFIGFGAPAAFGAHIFKVIIPSGRAGEVVINENYGFLAGFEGAPEHETRVVIQRSKWTPIADTAKRDFNARLRARKLPSGTWKPGENNLDRMLGKEICVLVWASEDASPEQIEIICRKWNALRPEERWWLYSMTAAEGGQKDDKERGWRKALFHALSDGQTPDGSRKKRMTIDDPYTLSLFS